MLDSSHLILFVVACLVMLLMPGPAVLYVISRSVSEGRRAGLVSVAGLAVGTLVHVTGAALGLSALLVTSALAFNTVKYLGAAYLIFLGVRRIMERKKTEETLSVQPQTLSRTFIQGIIVNVLNPKTALFFLAFLPQFVDPGRGSVPMQMILLGLLFVFLSLFTDSGYVLLSGIAGRWLKGSSVFSRFENYCVGTVYIGLGLGTAFTGFRRK